MTNLAVSLEEQAASAEVSELVVVASQQASVGQRLRVARQAKGWTEAQVARRLNLTESYVRAIESDDFDCLPGMTFVRGYMRNYATCLGLSVEDMLSVFEQQSRAAADPVKVRKREKLKAASTDPVMRIIGALSVLMFVLSSMFWWRQQDVAIAPVTETVTVVEVGTVSGETLVETLDLSVPQSEVAVAVGGDTLRVTFTDNSWLEVRDASGEVLFSGVKQMGETLQLTTLSSFDIAIGNAAAVKLSYNSAPVDLTPHTSNGNAAKLQLGL